MEFLPPQGEIFFIKDSKNRMKVAKKRPYIVIISKLKGKTNKVNAVLC